MRARERLTDLRRRSDRLAGPMLALGLASVAAYNAARWQEDRALALRLRERRRAPRPALATTPRVSMLVAAWNEAELIERHIQSVLGLRYPDLEYVLCAGGTDGSYELAKRFERPGVIVLEQRPGEGKQAALRRCLERASGEVIYLTDADCLVDDDSFERTLAPVVNGEAEAATGGSRPLQEQFGRSLLAEYRWGTDAYVAAQASIWSSGLLGRNAALTRDSLERAGGLDGHVPSGTDYHLAKCLLAGGGRIRLVVESEVQTRYAESAGAYLRQQRRWLRNVALLGRRYGAVNEAKRAERAITIGSGLLLAPMASPLFGWSWLGLCLLAVVQGALAKARYVAFGRALRDSGERPGPGAIVRMSLPICLLELLAWSLPLADLLVGGEAW